MDAAEEVLALARVRSWLRSGKAREIRERARLSQADVGEAAGTSMWQISRWEAGKAVPGREQALKLARLYGELQEIITEEEVAEGGKL